MRSLLTSCQIGRITPSTINFAEYAFDGDKGCFTCQHVMDGAPIFSFSSTMMDLRILPKELTEPTVSGVTFSRQAQVRWTQPLSKSLTMNVAIEDPSNTDVADYSANPELSVPRLPDGVIRFDLAPSDRWHFSLGGLLRHLRVEQPTGEKHSELGWGLQLSGHISIAKRDKFGLNGIIWQRAWTLPAWHPTDRRCGHRSGDRHAPPAQELGHVRHLPAFLERQAAFDVHGRLREIRDARLAAGIAFSNSTFASVNLMWQILPYLTFGAEYGYGARENKDGSDLDNHRFSLGFQFY